MIKILWWLGFSGLSAFLYRLGGKGGFPNAKLIRRLGCALITLILWIVLYGFKMGHIWAYLGFLALNYAALSTYHDYTGFDNFWLTGLCYGLSALPITLITGHWLGFGIRSVALAITIGLWSDKIGDATTEELGRGFLYTATILLLTI